ncbi:hypothetical protein [Roseicyclus marinus]|uniref:hypothetical protein n=1 Tax=Roseicyclus marinus TaxID=2161673 RepID=UPI00240EFACE|nr:hypothetical protein [Roseicyclus marinus]MDG3040773.1 hypothetical protein [Roseicyclus marinus]
MTNTELMWLRGQAAQRDVLHLVSYSAAFFGTAALQAMHLGLTAPRAYLAALSRAAVAPPTEDAPVAEVIPLVPVPDAMPEVPDAPAIVAVATPSPHLLDAPRDGLGDDLTTLKGVGPKLAEALKDFGIYHFDQIATLDDEGIAWLDTQQKGFRMICARHDIVAQARARM